MSRSFRSRVRIDRTPASRTRQGHRKVLPNLKHMFIAQAKLMRLIELIMFLQSARFTISQLADLMDTSNRTVYRYLNLLESLEFGVEKDFEGRYFMVEETCPLCGSKHTDHG